MKVPGDPERTETAKNPTSGPRGQVTSPSGSGCIQSQMPCSKSSAFPLPRPAENATNPIASALT